jgi:hypothetical protein
MDGSWITMTPDPQRDGLVDQTASDLRKEILTVAIDERNANHRSQNYEEKPQT